MEEVEDEEDDDDEELDEGRGLLRDLSAWWACFPTTSTR